MPSLDISQCPCDEDVGTPIVCPECGRSFNSEVAMGSHRSQDHGYRNIMRRYTFDTFCAICCVQFHTRPRLLHHLKRSKLCPPLLLSTRVPLSIEESKQLDILDRPLIERLMKKGLPAHFAEVPAFRMSQIVGNSGQLRLTD